MTALQDRRRRRTWTMLIVSVVAAVAAVAMAVTGAVALRHYSAATNAARPAPRPFPATPTALYGTEAPDGTLTSVAVFVLSPEGQGGSIVSVPVSGDATLGLGADRLPLDAAYAVGGEVALLLAAESLLSLTLDHAVVGDALETTQLLGAVGPVVADLPADVVNAQDGTSELLHEAGTVELRPEDVAQVLVAREDDATHASRRGNLDAVWAAVAAGADGGGPVSDTPVASFEDLVARLFAGPVESRGLPASAVDAAVNPDDLDVEDLDRAESILVFASLAPGQMSAPSQGLVFRIEAPPGYEAEVKEVVSTVLFFGGNVGSVNLAAEPRTETIVYVTDDSTKENTEETNQFLGAIRYEVPEREIVGIDATISLGTTFLDVGGIAEVEPA